MKKDLMSLRLHLLTRQIFLDRALKRYRSRKFYTLATITEGHRAEVKTLLRWLGDRTTHIKH